MKALFVTFAACGLIATSTTRAELRTPAAKEQNANPGAEPPFQKEFNDPVLKDRLKDSTWQFQDGKRFTLHADGTTTASWHARHGLWRIIGRNKLQLIVTWKGEIPSVVSVEGGASLLRWSDEEWGKLAKRVGPPEKAL